ncbi:FAD-dependent monooxygenase [Streptomyces sp. NPDC047525]|uniref:FAD-dependent monooxygenase n=1 Tax=Streptomyces sp. NPDC047525 TaxID=3155264 RepID=UPI0033C7C26F
MGGSIAGCAAALAAHRGGVGEIVVYERAVDRPTDRGVGLVMHNSRHGELSSQGYLGTDTPWVQLTRRRWYVRDGLSSLGREVAVTPFPFRTYTWGPLWHELRRRVPESAQFRPGTMVTGIDITPEGAELTTGSEGRAEHFDLVIGADGYRSVVRRAVCPDLRPEYAGYLAWRGAFPADRLTDPAAWADEDCVFAVFPGGQLTVFRIPDGAGGGHRVNWVLFTTPPTRLDLALNDPTSLPPGTVTEALHTHLTEIADTHLPPYWRELVGLTAPDELFIQPLYDFTAPQYTTDRLLLMGDAATVARPHTGAGTVKALQDATALESALTTHPGSLADALRTYDADRSTAGRTMVDLGRSLGQALVQEAPDWGAMDQSALDTWCQQADGGGALGGLKLPRTVSERRAQPETP